MKKHLKGLLADAVPLVAFLERESFFGRAYGGATPDRVDGQMTQAGN